MDTPAAPELTLLFDPADASGATLHVEHQLAIRNLAVRLYLSMLPEAPFREEPCRCL